MSSGRERFFDNLTTIKLSKNRAIADHALSAEACLANALRACYANEFNLDTQENSLLAASTAQNLLRSYRPMPLLSSQYLRQALRTKRAVLIASFSD
ncbi:hypothetical protein Cylst_1718 [Cylindrospermum stagnale PCC 7417]|uniref:Uncharacterized protein n=1 Tax=Cylindrospermum stagnale PCC 7417 TaxID=56107 RepID=K9WUC7_9NOST|nr:hypothetical protein Cylst_1718 [Cylindrospermum stagnale PCC 7417]